MLADVHFNVRFATIAVGIWAAVSIPATLAAQDRDASSPRPARRAAEAEWQSAGGKSRDATQPETARRATERSDRLPSGSRSRESVEPNDDRDSQTAGADQVWRDYNLAPYTMRLTSAERPERAVVDWIMHETGQETWHGEDPAVLCTSRGRLRAFHRPEVQDQVAEIVDRFVRPIQSTVSVDVDIVVTTDLNWRNGLSHLLKPVAIGEDGQHIWFIAREDASLVRERLRAVRGATFLVERHVAASNGAPTFVETDRPVNYISSLELASGSYIGYQPVVSKLHEGLRFAFTPLWAGDGTHVDLNLKLTTRAVRKLHHAQSVAPLSTGNQTTTVQVPEVSATLLERTVRWPVNQSMLISAGLQPAGLSASRGGLRLTTPVQEMLILAEVDPPSLVRTTKRPGESDPR